MGITVRTRDVSGAVEFEKSYEQGVKLMAEHSLGGKWTMLHAWTGSEEEPPEDADWYTPEVGGSIEIGPATDQADVRVAPDRNCAMIRGISISKASTAR